MWRIDVKESVYIRCDFMWNPMVWPYTTRCRLEEGHIGQHVNEEGLVHKDHPWFVDEDGS